MSSQFRRRYTGDQVAGPALTTGLLLEALEICFACPEAAKEAYDKCPIQNLIIHDCPWHLLDRSRPEGVQVA